jgi:transcriptional regulator with XRE-family HTH domain
MEKKSILLILGENIKQYRLEKGWSQEELADKSGLHRTYVGGIERGERNITVKVLHKLAITLDVEIGQLLKGVHKK